MTRGAEEEEAASAMMPGRGKGRASHASGAPLEELTHTAV
jgi:hypothetical protein|eukprot:SAG25_NODE_1655_length_2604_cov_1.522954_2_plen_40_part_00